MTDNTDQAEELLQEAKKQSRHTSEAPTAAESDPVDTVEAIKNVLLAVEDGDVPENINIRDARLKALLVGLQEVGELDATAQSLSQTLDSSTDIDASDATQSDVARLLIRIGLQEAAPDILEDATEASKQAALEQASEF